MDCLGIVIYCFIKFTYFVESKSSIKECFEVIWHYINSLWVKINCCLIISFFPCSITLRMKHFSLLFLLLKFQWVCSCVVTIWDLLLIILLLRRCLGDTHWIWLVSSIVWLLKIYWTIYRCSSLSIMTSRWHSLLSLILRWFSWINTWIQRIIMRLPHHH